MKQLPAALILEKNKLAGSSPWLVLLDVTLINPQDPEDTTEFHLVRNTENVWFGSPSQEYTAFPFELEPTTFDSKGQIPTVTLRVSNVTRVLQGDMEAYGGGTGSSVTVTVVNNANLAENYSELEMTFEIISTSANAQWIEIILGASNPLNQRFPLDRYIPTHCAWAFKSIECGYTTGAYTTCNRTLDQCEARARQASFGGFLGLRTGALRVV